ncbi:MAG: glycosyltransferase, partial [Legionella sp.]
MLPEIIQIRTFIVISVRIRQDDDNSVPEYSEERTANSSSNENSIHEEEAAEEVNSCLQLFSGFCEPHFLSSVLNPNEVLFPVTWRKTLWWLGTTTVLGGCIATEVLTSAFSTAANYNNFILMCMLYGVDPVIQTIAILSAKYPVQNKPREIKLTDEAVFRSNQDVAVVIPTHLAADKIEATLRSCLRHVNPEQIFIVDNGNSDFPMDDTPNIVRKMNPKINYIWGKFGNKTFAQYIGTLLANYKYIFTMDDDMRLPENFSFGTKLFNEKVKAVSYPIVAVHSQPLKSNLLVRWQSLEYKLSDCAKLSQARFGGVLYPHGAASMWERDTFLKILKRHDAIFFAEDVKLGMILKELGFSMGIAAGT